MKGLFFCGLCVVLLSLLGCSAPTEERPVGGLPDDELPVGVELDAPKRGTWTGTFGDLSLCTTGAPFTISKVTYAEDVPADEIRTTVRIVDDVDSNDSRTLPFISAAASIEALQSEGKMVGTLHEVKGFMVRKRCTGPQESYPELLTSITTTTGAKLTAISFEILSSGRTTSQTYERTYVVCGRSIHRCGTADGPL